MQIGGLGVLEEQLKSALDYALVPVGGTVQHGPNCGFYALQNTMYSWKEVGGEALPARKRKKGGTSLRQIGKRLQETRIGELWSAASLARVAQEVGYQTSILSPANYQEFSDNVKSSLQNWFPLIMAIDVNGGEPGFSGGENAHWVTVIGYTDNGTLRIAHTHWGNYYLSSAIEMFNSSQQLNFFSQGQSSTFRKDPGDKNYYSGGHVTVAHNNREATFTDEDLTELRGRLVRLEWPGIDPKMVAVTLRVGRALRSYAARWKFNPSQQSKRAKAHLEETAKANPAELAKLVAWYLGKSVVKPFKAGDKLKVDSSLYADLTAAFHLSEHLLR